MRDCIRNLWGYGLQIISLIQQNPYVSECFKGRFHPLGLQIKHYIPISQMSDSLDDTIILVGKGVVVAFFSQMSDSLDDTISLVGKGVVKSRAKKALWFCN